MSSLATFFAEMCPFLLGEARAEDVLARLGPCASGPARFALYATLVSRQRRGVIDHFYRAAAAAVPRALFDDLRDAYLHAHPPSHWEPNESARAFPGFVAEQPGVPTELVELADFAWIRFACMHASHDETLGLERALFVRHYQCDVVAFSDAVERGERAAGSPAVVPRTLLVTRDRVRGRLTVLTPSIAALVAIAFASGQTPALPDALRWSMVVADARALERRAVFASGTADRLERRVG